MAGSITADGRHHAPKPPDKPSYDVDAVIAFLCPRLNLVDGAAVFRFAFEVVRRKSTQRFTVRANPPALSGEEVTDADWCYAFACDFERCRQSRTLPKEVETLYQEVLSTKMAAQ